MHRELLAPMLSATNLLRVLADPLKYYFKAGVWYAINCPSDLDQIDTEYTLHGRLGLSVPDYQATLKSAGLLRQRQSVWRSKIADVLSDRLTMHLATAAFGTRTITFIAFVVKDSNGDPSPPPSFSPKEQVAPQSKTLQPWVISKSLDAVASLLGAPGSAVAGTHAPKQPADAGAGPSAAGAVDPASSAELRTESRTATGGRSQSSSSGDSLLHKDAAFAGFVEVRGNAVSWMLPTFTVDGVRRVPLHAVYCGPLGVGLSAGTAWNEDITDHAARKIASALGSDTVDEAVVTWPLGEHHPNVRRNPQFVLDMQQVLRILLKGGQVGDSERVAMASSYAASMSTASLADVTPQRWVQAFAFQSPSPRSMQSAAGTSRDPPRRYQASFIDKLCAHLHTDGNELMLARLQASMAGSSVPTSGLGAASWRELGDQLSDSSLSAHLKSNTREERDGRLKAAWRALVLSSFGIRILNDDVSMADASKVDKTTTPEEADGYNLYLVRPLKVRTFINMCP